MTEQKKPTVKELAGEVQNLKGRVNKLATQATESATAIVDIAANHLTLQQLLLGKEFISDEELAQAWDEVKGQIIAAEVDEAIGPFDGWIHHMRNDGEFDA